MFCTECGAAIDGKFCGSCGSAAALLEATDAQIVIAEIFSYVAKNWADDFEDYLAEIHSELESVTELLANRSGKYSAQDLSGLESEFDNFLVSGGFVAGTRYASLQKFLDEVS